MQILVDDASNNTPVVARRDLLLLLLSDYTPFDVDADVSPLV